MPDELNVEETGNVTEVAPETQDESTEGLESDTQTTEEVEVKTDGSEDSSVDSEGIDPAELQKQLNIAKIRENQLKNQLKDPNFVYNLAKEVGLTEEEAANTSFTPMQVSQMVEQTIATREDYSKALEILPELGTDPEIEAWGRALVDTGKSHAEAAKIIKSKIGKTAETAKAEGAKAKELEISEKEAAQTAPVVTNVDTDANEIATLREKSKSLNRVEQENAVVELLKRSMK